MEDNHLVSDKDLDGVVSLSKTHFFRMLYQCLVSVLDRNYLEVTNVFIYRRDEANEFTVV